MKHTNKQTTQPEDSLTLRSFADAQDDTNNSLYLWEMLAQTAERSDACETVCVGEAVSWVARQGEGWKCNNQHPSQPSLIREGALYPLSLWERVEFLSERSELRNSGEGLKCSKQHPSQPSLIREGASNPLSLWERAEFLSERSELRNSGEGLKSSPHPNLPHPGKEPFPRPTGEGRVRGQAAFTLAEVLITLGIIGVVAAMTIPGLITTYKAHQLKSQFLKSYSTVQQVFKQMEADDISLDPKTYTRHTFYKTFSNYLKVANDCGANDDGMKRVPGCLAWGNEDDKLYKSLGGNTNFYTNYLDDGQLLLMDGTNLFFENTSNSDLILVSVDINGFNNKPNRAGYDLFTFQFLDGELRTMGDIKTLYNNLDNYCNSAVNNQLSGIACAQKAKTDTDYFKKIIKEFK